MPEQDVIVDRQLDVMEEINALIKGGTPIIWVLTHEEFRFIEEFNQYITKDHNRKTMVWSAYQGLVPIESIVNIDPVEVATGKEKDTHIIRNALEYIVKQENSASNVRKSGICYIMRDMHIVLIEQVVRQIRDIIEFLTDQRKTLIILSPVLAHGAGGTHQGLPVTLEKQISIVNYNLPDVTLIKNRIQDQLRLMQSAPVVNNNFKLEYTNEEISSFSKALRGLTTPEIDTAVATCISRLHGLDIHRLTNEKKQIIARSDILEFVDEDINIADVGGLDLAKKYLEKYAKAQSDEAKAFGVEPLRGIILTGIAGSGKSLLAKVIGKMWNLPLLRLDVGRVMSGLVGSSEGKMRDCISQVEAVSPAVLWIDEVEKSLSGTKSSNFSDGGTLSRVFGTLLHAMQDKLSGVTIIATANDISMLPPEFIRRFNDVFFVDLPSPEERWEIFGIHLKKRNRDISILEKNKDKILELSEEFTGAEIEKVIKDAIAAAFYGGFKDVNAKDIIGALKDMKPIARTMRDKIQKIRDKARGNYRYASSYNTSKNTEKKVITKSGKDIKLNEVLDDLPELVKTKKEKNKENMENRIDRFSALIE